MILIMDVIANAVHRQDLIEEAEAYRRIKDENLLKPIFPSRKMSEKTDHNNGRLENVQV